MRLSPRFGDVLGWALAGAGTAAWMMLDGASLREALAVGTAGAAIGYGCVTLGNRLVRSPFRRIEGAALAGELVVLLGEGDTRAFRQLDGAPKPPPAELPAAAEADEVRLETTATWADGAARLWLTGEHRLALQGLQPPPAAAPEFIDGRLVVTNAMVARRADFPILILHRRSLAPDADELLTSLGLDGTARWTASFAAPCFSGARFLWAGDGRLLFAVQSDDHVCEAIALDPASGRVIWRRRV